MNTIININALFFQAAPVMDIVIALMDLSAYIPVPITHVAYTVRSAVKHTMEIQSTEAFVNVNTKLPWSNPC